MATVPSKHSRDQAPDFEGLLNNLQDWELSFKEKDKRLKSGSTGTEKLDLPVKTSRTNSGQLSDGAGVNGRQILEKTPSDNTGPFRDYDRLKGFDALSRLSGGFRSEESFVDANSEKELGNEFFKQRKFNEAIDCYSRSIALSPTAVAYANRAMAFIKIKRFQEAELDCSEALNLDDQYIKAYSRRSTTRKELGKLKESLDDAEFALRLDPQNQEIKKQFAEAKSLIQKEILKKSSRAVEGSVEGVRRTLKSEMRKISSVSSDYPARTVTEILDNDAKDDNKRDVPSESLKEIKGDNMRINGSDVNTTLENAKIKHKNEEQDLNASVQELAAKAANLAKAEAAKNIVPPSSGFEFEVSWRKLSGDRELQARLLKAISPTALPGIFKNALSSPVLVDIIRCIATFFMEDMALSVDFLLNLTKIPRFDMIVMCLSSTHKADLLRIWDEVFCKAAPDYTEILANLRSRYGIRQ
ncbi:uncharacterized protein LOC142531478 [Primulina tabacum]|uniref:uncharacterized protein LOC142531478 n=1 Tax=Primulina tabacum TaxID=48773 RepID=UPI003F5AC0D6